MRLGKETLGLIESQVSRALAGECVLTVPAPSLSLARRMYDGASPHVERLGGRPVRSALRWDLPNGSEIRIKAG